MTDDERRTALERPDHRAFLQWLERDESGESDRGHGERADGTARTWGQLLVTVEREADGRRVYELRHEADAATPRADLEVHRDPGDAHEIARFDATDRYRPLKTAPTLVDGWAFVDLDAAALIRTVDAFYPASIANWHREREGELDVTHWREAAERQSGIYEVVDELSDERVAWLAGACCVDSQCIRRRQWDETAEAELDVPRGAGEFPCREPCSLVIAAARELALAERDEPRPVELELTETELGQLERIVEAVATGETESIRDGDLDDGANRLRARFLREKLFDDGGRLRTRERGSEPIPPDREAEHDGDAGPDD